MATKKNGAGEGAESVRAIGAFLVSPGAAGFLVSQKIALEAARFWAKRMRAYADQFDTLAGCSDPVEMVSAQTRFVQRMQEDYAEESRAVAEIVTPKEGEAAREVQH